jgi:hypothetical protein
MANKYLIVCDNCGQERDNQKEESNGYVRVEYTGAINDVTTDYSYTLSRNKVIFDFCSDDCAKEYVLENGFKK